MKKVAQGKAILLVVLVVLSMLRPLTASAEPAVADPVAAGMAHVDAKRYPEAYSLFKGLVEKGAGGAEALFMLGYLTENGLGTEADEFSAASLYRRAWRGGSIPAMKRLDALYQAAISNPPAPAAPAQRSLKAAGDGKERDAKEKLRLVSGGNLSAITGDFTPGHLEVSREVLKKVGFSPDAVAFTADASQDPDLYHWGFPGAHAQTANDEEGHTSEDRDQAKRHFVDWMKELVRLLDREGEHSPRKSLYLIGYMLHAVQDLAAHRGMTDAQHSYASYVDPGEAKDCDHDPENIAAARDFTRRLIQRLQERRPAIYAAISAYRDERLTPGSKISDEDRASLFGSRSMNLSFSAYRRFEGLAPKYQKIRGANPFRPWNVEEVFAAVLETL